MAESLGQDVYFAAMPREEVGEVLVKKVEDGIAFLETTGYRSRIESVYNAYYGLSPDGSWHASSAVLPGGLQGELNLIKINGLRKLAQHILSLTVSQRPAFKARATKSDRRSLDQIELAEGLVGYCMRERKLEKLATRLAEYALLFAEAYIVPSWDPNAGPEYAADPDSGEVVKTGDIEYKIFTALDVIKDPSAPHADVDWYIIRERRNKYDVAARYPELRDKILEIGDDVQPSRLSTDMYRANGHESPFVYVYTFFHEKTPAVPGGRIVRFLSDDTILFDDPLPYREMPVYRMSAADMVGNPYGYTVLFDLLGGQEALDALYSTVLSNQMAFGVQNVVVDQGANVNVNSLAGGLNVIEKAPGKEIKPLNLLSTPREVFDFIERLKAEMAELSAINPVIQGQPPPNVKSGPSLAMVQSEAVRFHAPFQRSFHEVMERVATASLWIFQDFASIPRMSSILSDDKIFQVKEFSGDDLREVSRVVLEMGSLITQMHSGRMEVAKDLLGSVQGLTPQQYLEVVNTGRLEPLTQSMHAELMLIKEENEAMARGEPVEAMATDPHHLHVKEHACVLASIDARRNKEVVQQVQDHLQSHMEQWSNPEFTNLFLALGIPPIMPQIPGMEAPQPQQQRGGRPVGEGTSTAAAAQADGSQSGIPNVPVQ